MDITEIADIKFWQFLVDVASRGMLHRDTQRLQSIHQRIKRMRNTCRRDMRTAAAHHCCSGRIRPEYRNGLDASRYQRQSSIVVLQ